LIVSTAFGWGLGYFGQPHILNKFMAVRDPAELNKSKYVSLVWQIGALFAAAATGIVAIAYFQGAAVNPELIFVQMTKDLFHPFLAGLILCAILAATLSTVESQILVLASILAEDVYKGTFNPKASSKSLLYVSRASVFSVTACALAIASFKTTTIFELVNYCWVGLGCSFGPIVILALYSKTVSRRGALAGMVSGGVIGATWHTLGIPVTAMLPGFFAGIFVALLISRFDKRD
jgi:sodium/proline symporter